MRLNSPFILIVFLLAGIAIGWLLPRTIPDVRGSNADDSTNKQREPARPRGIDGGPDPASQIQGARVSTGRKNRQDTTSAAHGSEEQDTVRVPVSLLEVLGRGSGGRRLDQDLFSRDGSVEAALGITDPEKANIQSAWREVRQDARDLEARSARSEEIDEWSVRVIVPVDSPGLASLGAGFRSKVLQVLGGDRGEAFLALKQVDAMFSPAEGNRNYTITTESIGEGRWRYRMTLEGPDGNRVWVGEAIPDEIRHLTDLAGVVPSLEAGETE